MDIEKMTDHKRFENLSELGKHELINHINELCNNKRDFENRIRMIIKYKTYDDLKWALPVFRKEA